MTSTFHLFFPSPEWSNCLIHCQQAGLHLSGWDSESGNWARGDNHDNNYSGREVPCSGTGVYAGDFHDRLGRWRRWVLLGLANVSSWEACYPLGNLTRGEWYLMKTCKLVKAWLLRCWRPMKWDVINTGDELMQAAMYVQQPPRSITPAMSEDMAVYQGWSLSGPSSKSSEVTHQHWPRIWDNYRCVLLLFG